ncbi:Uu.00g096170.m01.CDS01 [Anthostomella pinea]|uniref:Uu.00g096170.m01.CDS01 n=1 Tax=Anthostomella pinea TaxID=933095 RepID=A0AAI8V746_9PEZI|nr:Uu.00g096170.m01.CDS01 [Anthostomella pinea]
MIQAISPLHDAHHERHLTSLAALTASHRDKKKHLLLAASGSVATIKLPLIIRALARHQPDLSIRVLLTPSATLFLAGQSAEQPSVSSLSTLQGVDGVYGDADEWREPWRRGAGILHIELRRWADLLVVAPLSANTMAKIVGGFADGILTSVVRAWDAWGELDSDVLRDDGAQGGDATGDGGAAAVVSGTTPRRTKKKRIIVAPAMNTAMWRHPITAKQLRVLEEEWGVDKELRDGGAGDLAGDGWFEVLHPQKKTLACGDIGDGAMMEWTDIVTIIEQRLGLASPNE